MRTFQVFAVLIVALPACSSSPAEEPAGDWIDGDIPANDGAAGTEGSSTCDSEECDEEGEDEDFDPDWNEEVLEAFGSVDDDGSFSGELVRISVASGVEQCVLIHNAAGPALSEGELCDDCTQGWEITPTDASFEEDEGCEAAGITIDQYADRAMRVALSSDEELYVEMDGEWVATGEGYWSSETGEAEFFIEL